jgi:hypothetical protein
LGHDFDGFLKWSRIMSVKVFLPELKQFVAYPTSNYAIWVAGALPDQTARKNELFLEWQL